MPRAILTFNLPKEAVEFRIATSGQDWENLVWTLDQQLRSWLKYGLSPEMKSPGEALQAIRDLLGEDMTERGLVFTE